MDRIANQRPRPGRTETFRRLNRTEYQNAIRDLLHLNIDSSAWLPNDESSFGFDNVTVSDLSPALMERYISAAQKISQLAVGRARNTPAGDTFRIRPDLTQEGHVEGLPLGTRGGARISYTFSRDGEYEIQVRLTRDRNEYVEGLSEAHEMEILVDRDRRASFTVKPPENGNDHQAVDQHLRTRFTVAAGPHDLGVTFIKGSSSLLETKRQPYQARFNAHRHPGLLPAVFEISITGPYGDTIAAVNAPSRKRIFVRVPTGKLDEDECAKEIVATLMRRAYRRPVTDDDFEKPLALYRNARASGDFESGIELALSAILVSPSFLFRIETEPIRVVGNEPYLIPDIDLASRLSFFIWSSIPDDELLELAVQNRLSEQGKVEEQVKRMLKDPRAKALTTNFANQWLHLRNLESTTPDLRLFPDFDDNLRQSFRTETEMLFEHVRRDDRPVLELLSADYTFLNERLAKHYGIPHVYGSRFRRVELGDDRVRGGLLRQGSILTVTSYATRTSPVIRGHWILKNLLGSPPPPPPANVPALSDNSVSAELTLRERLSEHRANDACASCHRLMDPIGFSLENFDALGRWRANEGGQQIDASGEMPDGSHFDGVAGLEKTLLQRPEWFVATMSEKLLTFALGRGVTYHDVPAIRKMVRDAQDDEYRFSSLVVGIATSTPFLMRSAE